MSENRREKSSKRQQQLKMLQLRECLYNKTGEHLNEE